MLADPTQGAEPAKSRGAGPADCQPACSQECAQGCSARLLAAWTALPSIAFPTANISASCLSQKSRREIGRALRAAAECGETSCMTLEPARQRWRSNARQPIARPLLPSPPSRCMRFRVCGSAATQNARGARAKRLWQRANHLGASARAQGGLEGRRRGDDSGENSSLGQHVSFGVRDRSLGENDDFLWPISIRDSGNSAISPPLSD
jgi:hypothetical protein